MYGVWMGRPGPLRSLSYHLRQIKHPHPDGCKGIGGREWDGGGLGMEGPGGIPAEIIIPPASDETSPIPMGAR